MIGTASASLMNLRFTCEWTELQWASVINDRGWISAEGYNREGTPQQRHGYILIPKFRSDAPCSTLEQP